MINNKYFQTFFAIIIGLIFGGIIIASTGENVFSTYGVMIKGGFGSPYYLGTTLTRATPIIMAGLAVSLSWRSGYTTIGMEGQMIFGAFLAAVVAVMFPGPAIVKTIVAVLAAMVIGAMYSLISGWLNVKFQVLLIISTLMMNYIAGFLVSYFTNYVVKEPLGADSAAVQTQKIAENVMFPRTSGNFTVDFSFVIAMIMVLVVWFLMNKTKFGYEIKMGGLNPKFASFGGINSITMMYITLILTGALAGLGGAGVALGAKGRYIDSMITSPGFAWTGIVAALMADFNPIGVFISSIFLAGLATGGSAVERSTSIPVEVTSLIQGIITLFMSAKFVISTMKKNKSNKSKEVTKI